MLNEADNMKHREKWIEWLRGEMMMMMIAPRGRNMCVCVCERVNKWERAAEHNYMLILWLCCEWWQSPFLSFYSFAVHLIFILPLLFLLSLSNVVSAVYLSLLITSISFCLSTIHSFIHWEWANHIHYSCATVTDFYCCTSLTFCLENHILYSITHISTHVIYRTMSPFSCCVRVSKHILSHIFHMLKSINYYRISSRAWWIYWTILIHHWCIVININQ